MNRRDFLKKSALTTGAVAGTLAISSTLSPQKVEAKGFGVKEHKGKTFYDVVETNEDFAPFSAQDTTFGRANPEHPHPLPPDTFSTWFAPKEHDKLGESLFDFALSEGAGLNWGDTHTHYKLYEGKPNSVDGKPYKFKDPKEASYYIKRAAKFYKASAVGIAKYDENLMYIENVKEFEELGFKPKSVVVIAILMDHEILKLYPMPVGMSGAALGYSNMAEVSGKLAKMMSVLGYSTHAGGNNWGISVAYGVAAGLGEGARMGTLIHPELGSGFRLVKVFTELELEPDAPITFGVESFCNSCMKCADHCPGKAIGREPKTYAAPDNISAIKGIKKWATDAVKCFAYWGEGHCDCGRCMTVCPYFKNDTWLHKFAKIAANTPGINNVARYMDDMFGYGKYPTQKTYDDFWNHIEV